VTLVISNGFLFAASSLVALTQWGMMGAMIYFLVVTIDHFTGHRCVRLTHMFNFMMITIEFLIFVFFWTVLFPGLILDEKSRAEVQK
jgi:hypothetical protein